MTEMDIEDLLELAIEYASAHPQFDNSFILSLVEQYEKRGELTHRQEEALERIVVRWRMEEWHNGGL